MFVGDQFEAAGCHIAEGVIDCDDGDTVTGQQGRRDHGPEASHESWMKQKLEEGWKYGPVKDPERKEHHCIVPFDQLPREQQAKDFLFRAVVHALKDGVQ